MSTYAFIASYPKSGNTWLRLMLLCAQAGLREVDINALERRAPALTRSLFDEMVGGDSEDLTLEEINRLRPFYHREVAREAAGRLLICRTHDYWRDVGGEPLIPPDACRAVVYITRDPRDVAVSLAHYQNLSIDGAITRMANPHARVANQWALRADLPQVQGSWSEHVRSWLEDCPVPLLHLRYEDMLADPHAALARAADLLGLAPTPDALTAIIASARFDQLQRQEAAAGYMARPALTERFFREGRSGQWRDVLTREQVRRIEREHGPVMQLAGYLREPSRTDGRRPDRGWPDAPAD